MYESKLKRNVVAQPTNMCTYCTNECGYNCEGECKGRCESVCTDRCDRSCAIGCMNGDGFNALPDVLA